MNIRRINLTLQLTAGVLASGAVVSLVAGLVMPVQVNAVATPIGRTVATTDGPVATPSLESFAAVFARSFQSPVIDAPAPTTTTSVAVQPAKDAPAPQNTAIDVEQVLLVGTIGTSLALLKGPDGSVQMAGPGEDVNGAVIVSIQPLRVDLRRNGKIVSLRRPPPPDDRAFITQPGQSPQ